MLKIKIERVESWKLSGENLRTQQARKWKKLEVTVAVDRRLIPISSFRYLGFRYFRKVRKLWNKEPHVDYVMSHEPQQSFTAPGTARKTALTSQSIGGNFFPNWAKLHYWLLAQHSPLWNFYFLITSLISTVLIIDLRFTIDKEFTQLHWLLLM